MLCGGTWRARTSRSGFTLSDGAIERTRQASFRPGFARELNERYRARLAGETLMVNELYISLVYRPQPNVPWGRPRSQLFGRGGK